MFTKYNALRAMAVIAVSVVNVIAPPMVSLGFCEGVVFAFLLVEIGDWERLDRLKKRVADLEAELARSPNPIINL